MKETVLFIQVAVMVAVEFVLLLVVVIDKVNHGEDDQVSFVLEFLDYVIIIYKLVMIQ